MSMGTEDSESGQHCGEDGGDGEEEEDEGEQELDSRSTWCSWAPVITLFIAFCISRSMRCFSRFGMRPNRTAAGDNCASLNLLTRQKIEFIGVGQKCRFNRYVTSWTEG